MNTTGSLTLFKVATLGCLLLVRPLAAQNKVGGHGLRGTYYNGMNFEQKVLTRADAAINFTWEKRPPAPGVDAEFFSVRWEGWLLVPVTGDYEFSTVMDDGLRFWLGGKRLIDSWRDQDHVPASVRIRLTGGRYYRLRVDYFQNRWDSRALLQWRRPDAPAADFEPVGQQQLFATLPSTAKPIPEPPSPAAVAAVKEPRMAVPASPPVARPTLAPVKPAAVVGRRPKPGATVQSKRIPPSLAAPQRIAAQPAPVSVDTMASLPDLGALRAGTTITLPSLYFTQSTASLLASSYPTLNHVARTLRAQADLRLEIAGHTDNVGEPALNQHLSEQRARTVRKYLVQQGIDSTRLTARGYGGTRPVADNRDPQQRVRNRRVEVVVQ